MADDRYGTSTTEAWNAIRHAVEAGVNIAPGATQAGGTQAGSLTETILSWLRGVGGRQADRHEALRAAFERIVAEIARQSGTSTANVLSDLSEEQILWLLQRFAEETGEAPEVVEGAPYREFARDLIQQAQTEARADERLGAGSADALDRRAQQRSSRIRSLTVHGETTVPLNPAGSEAPQGPPPAPGQQGMLRYEQQQQTEETRRSEASQRLASARAAASARIAGFSRLTQTGANGEPLAEDGLPLVDPVTGQTRVDSNGQPLQPLLTQFIGYGGPTTGLVAHRQLSAANLGPGSADTLERRSQTRAVDPQTGEPIDYLPVAARYQEGMQDDPAGWSTERRGRLQTELIRAGLLDPDAKFTFGDWGPSTRDAYAQLLAYANHAGLTDRQAARELQTIQTPELINAIADLRATSIAAAEAQLAPLPDLATLRDTIRQQVADFIGADPTDEEMSVFLTALDSDYQASREQQEALIAQQVDAELAAQNGPRIPEQYQTGLYGSTTSPLEQQAAQIAQTTPAAPAAPERAIDPEARLKEMVAERLAPQRDLLESTAADASQQRSIYAGVSQILSRRRGP